MKRNTLNKQTTTYPQLTNGYGYQQDAKRRKVEQWEAWYAEYIKNHH